MDALALPAAEPSVPVLHSQEIRSWPKYPAGGPATYVSLHDALTRVYTSDAQFAAYSVPAIGRRLSRDALRKPEARAALTSGVAMVVVIFDVDCPAAHNGDPAATDAWWLDENEKVAALLGAHPGGFVYRTRGGYRIVYLLLEPIILKDDADADGWSVRYCGWIAYLKREFEIEADVACRDWTRLFRLPHATRDEGGQPELRETRGDPGAIGGWVCSPTSEDLAAAKQLSRKRESKRPLLTQTASVHAIAPTEGVLPRLFQARGWLGDEVAAGKWNAACPNEEQHSKGARFDGSTVLYAPSAGEIHGWLHCSHAHCVGRTLRDTLAAFTEAEVDAVRPKPPPIAQGARAIQPIAVRAHPTRDSAAQPVDVDEQSHKIPFFQRGDHPELGHYLLDRLEANRQLLVHDEGEIHRYRSETGLWDRIDPSHLKNMVGDAAGAPSSDGPLEIKASDAAGAIVFACARVHNAEFFSAARRGVHFKNGFFELADTGDLRLLPHAPEHRARSGFAFDLPESSDCPRWLSFLDETFKGDADAAEKIAFLQEIGGAGLLAIAPRYQKDAILVGDGANGKSVVIDVIAGCMPPGTTCSIPPQDWGDQYRLALLAGKHLNVVSELPEADILASGAYKSVVTGDQTTGRQIRQPPFTFRPCAAHIFATNSLPRTLDHSHGFWRRHEVTRFNNVVPEDRQDRGLAEAILAAERPGIIRWLLEGAVRLVQTGGYTAPASSAVELDQWKKQTDLVALFLEECTERVEDPRHGTPARQLYKSFRGWGEESGHRNLPPSNRFGERMRMLGHPAEHTRLGNFYPVRLASSGEPPASDDEKAEAGEPPVGDGCEGREGPTGTTSCARARRGVCRDPSRPSQPSQPLEADGHPCTTPQVPASPFMNGGEQADVSPSVHAPAQLWCANCRSNDLWVSRVSGDRRCRVCAPPSPGAEVRP